MLTVFFKMVNVVLFLRLNNSVAHLKKQCYTILNRKIIGGVMILIDYTILSHRIQNEKNQFESLIHRIDDFQVMILYDRQSNHFDYNYLVEFPSEKMKNKIHHTNIIPRLKSETFMIWQSVYEQNLNLFYKLRLSARNEVLQRLTEFMVAKFFSVNEDYLAPLLKDKPSLKWEFINQVYSKYEAMIHMKTRLNNEEAWEAFNQWFKGYLRQHIMREMLRSFSYSQLMMMDHKEINNLFFDKIHESFSGNDHFMDAFTNDVNQYLGREIEEMIGVSVMNDLLTDDLQAFLKLDDSHHEEKRFESTIKNNYLIVMSNAIYQFTAEALSNQQFGKVDHSPHPTAMMRHHIFTGQIQVIPKEAASTGRSISDLALDMWQKIENLSELDVDVMDAVCHLYLAQSMQLTTSVKIQIDDLLNMRGLKPKLSGSGRRGGFEQKQREQVLNALSLLQNIWITVEDIPIYENGRKITKALEGPIFQFQDLEGRPVQFNGLQVQDEFIVTIGDIFDDFLAGSNRQVKLLPKIAIEYNPYQQKWEKKLMRYLSWRWRTQARKASYLQPHKINTLLEKLAMPIQSQTPSRIRDRLEKALDTLLNEGVISFWQYDQWDEANMAKKGWLKIWKEATILISPSNEVMKYYQPLERKKSGKRG